MNTFILSAQDPSAIDRAFEILKHGGLVAFPTDTVYGVAAMVNDASAIERLFVAKGRDFNKAIAVLVAGPDQVPLIALDFSAQASHLARLLWPGALTLVVARNPSLPENISPLPTVGVRMPDHPFTLALLQRTGPLATTSANISGETNPLNAQDVLSQLSGKIDLVIDGGQVPAGVPSTVVDCTQPGLPILRHGAISDAIIQSILSSS